MIKIISGAQTGVDIAALEIAKELGFQTGGYMTKGYRTQDGPRPEYKQMYGIIELDTYDYKTRTFRNAQESDATIRIYKFDSPGEICTQNAVRFHKKPMFDFKLPIFDERIDECVKRLRNSNYQTINFAGHSEKSYPGINIIAKDIIREILTRYQSGTQE